ncbi:MAG TPA: hypothetical protein VH372_05870, partial [Actinospica sp.]|nr:hypothetical protein [Actinospica sp.]
MLAEMRDADRRRRKEHRAGRQLRARDACCGLAHGAGGEAPRVGSGGAPQRPGQQHRRGARRKHWSKPPQLGGPSWDGLGERGTGRTSAEVRTHLPATERPPIAVGDLPADLIAGH